MLISHAHRFTFVHIPKCAGTSLRSAISHLTAEQDRYWLFEDVPEVGLIDRAHMPLWFLQQHFPDRFDAVRNYRSYALLRDPSARFLSSVAEHFRNFQEHRAEQMMRSQVIAEVGKIIADLRGTERVIQRHLIHFARQSDFVMLDGEQVVEALYPVDEIDAMLQDLSHHVGQAVSLPATPQRSRGMTGFTPRVRAVLRLGKSVVDHSPLARYSTRLEAAIRPYASRFQTNLSIDWLANRTDVQDFVAEYYAEDFALFHALRDGQRRRQPTAAGQR